MELRIELLSPTCTAGGIARPGVADREVSFDRFGLPVISGRTLKGLLRDAYEGLLQTAAVELGLPPANVLFGAIGASDWPDEETQWACKTPAAIAIRDARPDGGAQLAAWLEALWQRANGIATIRREGVMEYYCLRRYQTAINRRTRAPEERTLRSTRTLRRGLTLRASLDELQVDPAPETYKLSLGLAAAAVERLGTSRTRGLGAVRLTLQDDDQNLTAAAISLLERGESLSPVQPRPDTPALSIAPDALNRDQGPHVLLFEVLLQEPAVFPTLDGDPNTVATLRSVPGSAIRGWLATRYLAQTGGRADDRFYRLFCSGSVAFLAAQPAIENAAGSNARSTPVPASVRALKGFSDTYIDLVSQKPQEPLRRVGGCTVLSDVGDATAPLHETSVELQYHHARPRDDKRIGRAVGAENAAEYDGLTPERSGALFTYERLAPGQSFLGGIVGSPGDLEAIRQLAQGRTKAQLGRSKSAGYGGHATWNWLGEPRKADSRGGESAGWAKEEVFEESVGWPAQTIVVTLLSPLVAVSRIGHPSPEFPVGQLARAVRIEPDASGSSIVESYARTEWISGYLSHQRLPRQQMPALSAGSVYVVALSREITHAEARIAETQSYGLRIEDGYGRIAIQPLAERAAAPKFRPARPSAAIGTVEVREGTPEWDLALDLFRRRIEECARRRAWVLSSLREHREANGTMIQANRKVSKHLLYRLLQMVDTLPVEDLHTEISNLRQTASNQLQHCLVCEDDRAKTLRQFLCDESKSWAQRFTEDFLLAVWADERLAWGSVFGGRNPLLSADAEERQLTDEPFAKHVVRIFLSSYLRDLIRQAQIRGGEREE